MHEAVLEELQEDATLIEKTNYEKHNYHLIKVTCLLLATMVLKLRKSFENLWAFKINGKLNIMFQVQARHDQLKVMKCLLGCKVQEGGSFSTHVLKMKGYIDRIECLGVPFP